MLELSHNFHASKTFRAMRVRLQIAKVIQYQAVSMALQFRGLDVQTGEDLIPEKQPRKGSRWGVMKAMTLLMTRGDLQVLFPVSGIIINITARKQPTK